MLTMNTDVNITIPHVPETMWAQRTECSNLVQMDQRRFDKDSELILAE